MDNSVIRERLSKKGELLNIGAIELVKKKIVTELDVLAGLLEVTAFSVRYALPVVIKGAPKANRVYRDIPLLDLDSMKHRSQALTSI